MSNTLPQIVKHSLNSQIRKWRELGRNNKECLSEQKQLLRREIDRGRIAHLEYIVRTENERSILDVGVETNGVVDEPAIVYALRTVSRGEFVASLINLGVRIDTVSPGSRTCIHMAISSEVRYSVLAQLLNSLKQRLTSEQFHTVLNYQDSDGFTALHRAISSQRCVKYCVQLIQAGALTNTRGGGTPTLHRAVVGGNRRLVRMLLANCVDLDSTDSEGNSALFHARDFSMFRLLLRYGIDTGLKNAKGQTILCSLIASVEQRALNPAHCLKLIKMLDSFDGIHHIPSTFSLGCHPSIRARLRWIKLRRIVRGRMLPFNTISSRSELSRCLAYCDIPVPSGYHTPTVRSLRNLLRIFTYCAFDDVPNVVNEFTLLQSRVSEVPAEFRYITRNETNAYFFDIRELVKLKINPYTNEPFTVEQIAEFESRLSKIRYLRETMEISRLDDLLFMDMDSDVTVEQLKIDTLHSALTSLPCTFFDRAQFTRFRADATASLIQITLGNPDEFTLLSEYMEEDPRLDELEWRRSYVIDMLYEIVQEQYHTAMSVSVAITDVVTMETNIKLIAETGVVYDNDIICLSSEEEARILHTASTLCVLPAACDFDEAKDNHAKETDKYAKKCYFCAAIAETLNGDVLPASRRRALCTFLFSPGVRGRR